MKQVAITVKIDEDLKKDVQKLAKNLGLSFSAIVENKLREVRRERRIEFEEELVPNKATAKILREIEEDWVEERKEMFTGPMDAQKALKYLKSLPHAD